MDSLPERRLNDELMLSEFAHLNKELAKIDKRMEGMETTMTAVALQSGQIDAMGQRVTKLERWNVHQAEELKQIAKFQGGCVRYSFESVVEKQWVAIKWLAGLTMAGFGILVTIMVALK